MLSRLTAQSLERANRVISMSKQLAPIAASEHERDGHTVDPDGNCCDAHRAFPTLSSRSSVTAIA